ncbi:MAG: glycosyltransferase [Chloroflexota bacterium]
MRITVLGPTHPFRGGIAHHTTLLVRALRRQHKVQFLSLSRQYPSWLYPGRSDQDPSSRHLEEPNQPVLSPFEPWTWINTVRHIRRFRPEILIIPWWVPLWAPVWSFVSRVSRIARKHKIVFVCHNVLPHEPANTDRFLTRLALGGGDGFVVHSSHDGRTLQQFIQQAAISKLPMPLFSVVESELPDQETARRELGLDPNQPVVLFFGFVRPYKGLNVLLEAMPRIIKDTDAHLLVVGEMWKGKQEYLDRIHYLGISRHVTLVDQYVPNEELPKYFVGADLVALPYMTATQSAVVQLAFSFGKPVVSTNVGGLAEAVNHGVNGLLVPPNDPSALAAAIISEIKKPHLQVHVPSNVDGLDSSWIDYANSLVSIIDMQGDDQD